MGGLILGCTDPNGCNYNPDATEDDGSCLEEDCLGECGGDAVIDECGVCDGEGIPDDNCDCFGNVDDCAGECGGDAVIDECGVCDGDGSSCQDEVDVILSLDGGNLNYVSLANIAGFQFDHNGCVESAGGGDAASNGFTVSLSSSTVLAFSFSGTVIPAGEGTLIELGGVITDNCLFDFVFSGEGASSLDVEFYIPPCDDLDSDEICDDVDDCVGDYDECGICNGNGTSCPDIPQNLIATGGLNQITLNWAPALTQFNESGNIDRDVCDPISNWCYNLSTEQALSLIHI